MTMMIKSNHMQEQNVLSSPVQILSDHSIICLHVPLLDVIVADFRHLLWTTACPLQIPINRA